MHYKITADGVEKEREDLASAILLVRHYLEMGKVRKVCVEKVQGDENPIHALQLW